MFLRAKGLKSFKLIFGVRLFTSQKCTFLFFFQFSLNRRLHQRRGLQSAAQPAALSPPLNQLFDQLFEQLSSEDPLREFMHRNGLDMGFTNAKLLRTLG